MRGRRLIFIAIILTLFGLAFDEETAEAAASQNNISHDTSRFPKSNTTASSGTAVIMYDTRSPLIEGGNYTFWKWSATLNFEYARRHGYDFIYMLDENDQTIESNAASDGLSSVNKQLAQCILRKDPSTTVPQSVPWCKLLAVAAAFDKGYELVVYIDSDAFFKSDAPSIATILKKYAGPSSSGSLEKPLWVPNNAPYSPTRANSGMQIWNHSVPTVRALLNQWWKLDFSANDHPTNNSTDASRLD
ncbi:hypothetical protein ACHAWF_004628 [Thalassiosira exigua]